MSRGGIGSASRAGIGAPPPAAPPSSSSRHTYTRADIDSSFDGDPHDLISASLDAEFSGGQWINGEFFYQERRETRRMTKEEQLYGYDDEMEMEHQKSQRRSRKPPAGGIAFVLGSTLQPEGDARQQKEKAEAAQKAAAAASSSAASSSTHTTIEDGPIPMDESEESTPAPAAATPSFQELRQAKTGSKRRNRDEMEDVEASGRGGMGFGSSSVALAKPKPPPAKVDKDFGAFNKHGTGFGVKMLAKFGYRPGDRLGKEGTGVATPITAKLRPNSMGLGFGDFKEVDKNNMARNAFEEQQLEAEKAAEKAKKAKEKEEKAKANVVQSWKSSAASTTKSRRIYKTAEEVLAESTQTVAPMVVLDYRGGHAKVTSLDQVSSVTPMDVSSDANGPAPPMLPELQYNLRQLVSMQEESLRSIETQRKLSQRKLENLQQQKDDLETLVETEEGHIGKMQQIVQEIEEGAKQLKSISKLDRNALGRKIHVVAGMLAGLRKRFPHEYSIYELPQRALPMVYPLIKGLLHAWEPFSVHMDDGERINVLEHLALFKPLLGGNDKQQLVQHTQLSHHRHLPSPNDSIYNQLLEELFLPRLRLEISNAASCSIRDHQKVTQMLLQIKPVCTVEVYAYVVTQLVYPLLKTSVASWNPRVDKQALNEWILPYTPFLPEDLCNKLNDSIRQKLSIALQEWDPKDQSAVHVISPWLGKFKPDVFESFIQRAILPKLIQEARRLDEPRGPPLQPMNDAAIKSLKATLDSVFAVLRPWIVLLAGAPNAVIPSANQPPSGPPSAFLTMRSLLIQQFLPRWFVCFHGKLTSLDEEGDDVVEWSERWKVAFSALPTQIAQDQFVVASWKKVLDMSNLFANEQHTQLQQTLQQTISWLQTAYQPSGATKPSASPSVAASITQRILDESKDPDEAFAGMIAQFAKQHGGIEFFAAVEKGKVNGKQIYKFGRSQVYLTVNTANLQERNIYLKPDAAKKGDAWHPVSLTQLLSREKKYSRNDAFEADHAAVPTAAGVATPTPSSSSVPMDTSNEDVD